MPTVALPPNHHRETLTPYSPAVYGRLCAVTGEPLRAGDEVVVCDARPGSDPMLIEGWTTQGSCPHCGAVTGTIVYVPPGPVWGPPPAPPTPPAPPPERSRALVGGLAGLFLLALAAMAVAIFLFVARTRQPTEPPATSLPIAALTATAAATLTMTLPDATATTAPNATATPGSPTPPTAPPSKTPPPTAAVPTPTLMPTPTPPPDSPITALVLVNPGNERAIRALRADDTVDLSQIGRNTLTVRAEVDSSAVESVIFLLDGDAFCVRGNCVENAAPYYMGGDQSGDAYEDWDWSRMLGSHTLTAIACTGDSGSGSCFPPVEVRLTVNR